MSIILEVWDIYEHNARIINYSLILKSFGHQQLSFRTVLYAFLDIIFTDPVKLKE